jgi:glycosyltransferase involved in cell wall biosynthesis
MLAAKNPFISIIIPCYNSSLYINNCLNSISVQNYDNYEVLIMDGGSTDSTVDIVKKIQEFDSRILINVEKDAGIYDAMNKGIRMAKGEYILFLGSDDTIYQNNVFTEIYKLRALNMDVIYGNVFNMESKTVYDGIFSYQKLLEKNICHQSMFIKKQALMATGLYKIKYKLAADWENNLKLFKSDKITKLYIDKIIANFNETGFSNTNFDTLFENKKEIEYFKFYKNSHSFLDKLRMIKGLLLKSLKFNKAKDFLFILMNSLQILF